MSEHDDDLVARRYRELRRHVPSAALDVKVLAAARSAVAPRSFTRRWGAPLAAAAVLVLAVGITLQVQHEEKKPALAPAPSLRSAQAPFAPAPRPEGAPEPIPFAPRRALEPASPEKEAAPADNLRAKTEAASLPPAATGQLAAPARADLRLQKQAEEAARAAAALAPAGAGPFTIDQATTSGVQVRVLPPR